MGLIVFETPFVLTNRIFKILTFVSLEKNTFSF